MEVPGDPMLWNEIQVEGSDVMRTVKGCLGHVVKFVMFPSNSGMLSFRGRVSGIVGSAGIKSDGQRAFSGTAKVAFGRSKIDWTQMKDKDSIVSQLNQV